MYEKLKDSKLLYTESIQESLVFIYVLLSVCISLSLLILADSELYDLHNDGLVRDFYQKYNSGIEGASWKHLALELQVQKMSEPTSLQKK